MTNLDSILKSRDITLLTMVCKVKAMVFPVVMCGCESWPIKNTECQRIWCWKRLLRVIWTSRRSNQSILKEINPKYSLYGLMLKLKLQYFGHLTQRLWCWKRLREGGEAGDRGLDGWISSPSQWTWVWVNSRRYWRTAKPSMLQSMGSQMVWHNLATERPQQIYICW